jgi:hypothetical protein
VLSAGARAANLYCQCETIAASPNQVKLEWPSTDGNTIELTEKDLCESPLVPTVMKPSPFPSQEAFEAGATSNPAYQAGLAGRLAELAATPGLPTTFTSVRTAAITACETAFQAAETTLDANGDRSDLSASAGSCLPVAYVSLGVQLSLSEDATLNVSRPLGVDER